MSSLALAFSFALIYGATAARTVQGFDSGELTAVAANWGVAHPPGFATWNVLAGVAVHLSPLPAALIVALVSALAGAVACGLVCATLRELGVRPLAALAAACAWGLMAPTWRLHSEQEVFATAHCFVALLAWLAVRALHGRLRAAPFWLGLASAAGAGAHTTVVLAAPMVGVALWRREHPLRSAGLLCLGVLLGLTPQLYLLWAAAHGGPPRWGAIDGPCALVSHILRTHYGALSLALNEHSGYGMSLVRYLVHLLRDGAGIVPLAAAVAVFPMAGARSRFRWSAVASFGLCLAFFSVFATPDTPWWHEIVQRFFPAADIYAALLLGLGLDRLLQVVPASRSGLARGLLVAWLAVLALCALPRGPSIGRDSLAAYADAVLGELAPNAILIGEGDDDASAFWEAQLVRQVRADVGYVQRGLLPLPWYADWTARVASGYRQPHRMAGISKLIEHAHANGRPVYLTVGLPPALQGRYALEPAGIAVRVLRRNEPRRRPADVRAAVLAFLRRHPLRQPRWQEPSAAEREIARRYRVAWQAVAGAR